MPLIEFERPILTISSRDINFIKGDANASGLANNASTKLGMEKSIGRFVHLSLYASTYRAATKGGIENGRESVFYKDLPVHLAMAYLISTNTGKGCVMDVLEKNIYTNDVALKILEALADFEIDIPGLPPLYVYAIRDTLSGAIKLGISEDPERRIKELQTGCDGKLEMIGYVHAPNRFQDEDYLHRLHADCRKRGEWFLIADGVDIGLSSIKANTNVAVRKTPFKVKIKNLKDMKISTLEIAQMTDSKHSSVIGRFKTMMARFYPDVDIEQFAESNGYNLPMHLGMVVFTNINLEAGSKLLNVVTDSVGESVNWIDAFNDFDFPVGMPKDMFIYLIENTETGNFKCGISCDTERRIKELQTCNPGKLRIVGIMAAPDGYGDEDAAHRLLGPHRIHGEWFRKEALGLLDLK